MKYTRIAIGLLAVVFSVQAHAMILPKNKLHLQERHGMANITEEEFNKVVDHIVDIWKPYAEMHGATLTAVKKWNDETVNAYAEQQGKNWYITMFGGLARRPEVTVDGFAMVVCHELGHHFGGYVFYGDNAWASAEGQADYWATQVCGRRIWQKAFKSNFRHYQKAGRFSENLAACDKAWSTPEQRALCVRIADAGLSLGKLLAAAGGEKEPNINTPDPTQVRKTVTYHPRAQCRVDTYTAGAACTQSFNLKSIPGRHHPKGQTSVDAEKDAAEHSCTTAKKFEIGSRPRCWFKPLMEG